MLSTSQKSRCLEPETAPLPTSPQGDGMPTRSRVGTNTYVILRLPAVLKARGRSRSTHYCDIKQGLFPRPVSLGARAIGWPEHELEAINHARIAGMNDDEIRALVVALEAERKRLGQER